MYATWLGAGMVAIEVAGTNISFLFHPHDALFSCFPCCFWGTEDSRHFEPCGNLEALRHHAGPVGCYIQWKVPKPTKNLEGKIMVWYSMGDQSRVMSAAFFTWVRFAYFAFVLCCVVIHVFHFVLVPTASVTQQYCRSVTGSTSWSPEHLRNTARCKLYKDVTQPQCK